MTTARAKRRCAIYTCKSSEEGLEQDFNSLDAQREACEAYVLSQRHEGWVTSRGRYDDGGFSGGSIDRPALQRLLADVKSGNIEVVVVYKVDRLTRSLADFAKIVEIFDAHGVSFVSVTQQFNTTSSMGRLTLNVLLSFAQFEREVTAERIRDKIAASKQKGFWMGGLPLLGYDVQEKRLVVNPTEAEVVREIFCLYLEIGSVRALKEELDRTGFRTKRRILAGGREVGGGSFSRGHLHALLSNRLYIGKIRHRSALYNGQHQAIVDERTFAAVQEQLASRAPRRCARKNRPDQHLLTGIIYDETGDRLSPTHAVKAGKRYRYYVSHRLIAARRGEQGGWRLPAAETEDLVLGKIKQLLTNGGTLLDAAEWKAPADQVRRGMQRAVDAAATLSAGGGDDKHSLLRVLLRRIDVCPSGVHLRFAPDDLCRWLAGGDGTQPATDEGSVMKTIDIPAVLRRRGVEARLVLADEAARSLKPDAKLVALIAKAQHCLSLLIGGEHRSMEEVAKTISLPASEVSRILPLAFLAPSIVQAVIEGRQPTTLTAERLKRQPSLPVDWSEQRQLLGFA